MGNTFKTAFLLTALTLLLMFFGRYFGGQNGMFLALAFAAVMNFVSYFYSDKIALAMYRAQPVTREQLPRAFAAVERLTPEDRHSHAEDVCDPHRIAQRFRHRTQSEPRLGRSDRMEFCNCSTMKNWKAFWRTNSDTSTTATS